MESCRFLGGNIGKNGLKECTAISAEMRGITFTTGELEATYCRLVGATHEREEMEKCQNTAVNESLHA